MDRFARANLDAATLKSNEANERTLTEQLDDPLAEAFSRDLFGIEDRRRPLESLARQRLDGIIHDDSASWTLEFTLRALGAHSFAVLDGPT